jgi:hypothetical protein
VRAEADSGIAKLGRDVREKVKGEETLVTKISRNGKEAVASGRFHHGGTEDTEKE